MRYGTIEWTYAEPIARALVESAEFRRWFVQQTRFAPYAKESVVLHEEMKSRRSPRSESWWRSHYSEKCRCQGCSGQETDLLAVFGCETFRFALHVEIKRPGDKFSSSRDQARNYALRAQCWVRKAPAAILPHEDADTVLVYSATQSMEFAEHLGKFGRSLTFEAIARTLPSNITLPIS